MTGLSTLAAADRGASPPWRAELAQAFRDPAALCRHVGVDPAAILGMAEAAASFPVLVPRGFADRMRRGDPDDPLLRQVLATGDETTDLPGFVDDPLAESACAAVPGMLRKYHGRALLVATGACAVHCRYCFRRHFPYDGLPRGGRWWESALAAIAADPSIDELILSGGDPLTLPDAQLAALVAEAAAIPHLVRLRVHTRLPVVLPTRVDDGLLGWLAGGRLSPVVVIHANHPAEIDAAVAAACGRLRSAGITVLNQTVLLAGVNDDVPTLAGLSHRLFAAGVLPYYLHLLDRVRGAGHFLVDDARATSIAAGLAALLPGYLVPRLVREVPGAPGKVVQPPA
jgi:EF-P beta-lysylation protein EpmB